MVYPSQWQTRQENSSRSPQVFLPTHYSFFFRPQLQIRLPYSRKPRHPLKHISFDTLLASYVLDPQNRRHNLDELALEKFKHVKIPIESLIGKGKNEISMRDVPIEKVSEYCCEDIDYTTRLKEFLFEEELQERKLDLFYTIELPLLPILAEMERDRDLSRCRKIAQSSAKTRTTNSTTLKKLIFQISRRKFNLNSPKQLSEILYQKLDIGSQRHSTSADILEELADEHPDRKTHPRLSDV